MADKGVPTVAGPVTAGVILTKFMVAVRNAYDQSPLKWLTESIPMEDLKEILGGLGSTPQMKEFFGTNIFQNITEQELTMVCREFQAGVSYKEYMPQHKIWRFLNSKIPQLAQGAVDHAVILLSETLNSNPLCYDGKALFADDHPVKGGVNDNLISGTGTTADKVRTDYWTVISTHRKMKDDQGQYLHRTLSGQLVRCPPSLEDPFRTLQEVKLINSGDENILKNRYELWVDVLMPETNDWEHYITNEAGKIILHGEFQAPMTKMYKDEDANLIKVSAHRIHGMIPGDYTLGVRVTNV